MARGNAFRLTYRRGEQVRFVSHLDFVRVFERAIRRAGVDVAYSGGFNPRMELVFGNPLPVGTTSDGELCDITLQTETDSGELMEAMNRTLPGDIRILSAEPLEKPYQTIIAAVSRAEYTVTTDLSPEDALRMEETYRTASKLVTMKKSKSGIRETDIRPLLYDFSVSEDGTVKLTAATGQEANLRPEVAVRAVAEACGLSVSAEKIHKNKMY